MVNGTQILADLVARLEWSVRATTPMRCEGDPAMRPPTAQRKLMWLRRSSSCIAWREYAVPHPLRTPANVIQMRRSKLFFGPGWCESRRLSQKRCVVFVSCSG